MWSRDGDTGGVVDTGGRGDVMKTGRDGGRGETGGEEWMTFRSCCCGCEKDGDEQVKEEVEEEIGGGVEVRGGGLV